MDLRFTPEEIAFRDEVRAFFRAALPPDIRRKMVEGRRLAKDDQVRWQRILHQKGWAVPHWPREWGGTGWTPVQLYLFHEEMQQAPAPQPLQFGVSMVGPVIYTFGNDAQKRRFLPAIASLEEWWCQGFSEPGAGSYLASVKTTAKRDGEHYVVNGSKVFGTHSAEASLYLIYCRFGPGLGGIGSILVERGTPGFTVGKPSMFLNGEEWSALYFEDCRVPKENLLLGPGGFKKQIAAFNAERIGNTARSLAVGRYAYERAKEHAAYRKQFGRTLNEFQGIQWKFADMALKLEAAQLLLYRAATNADRGLPSAYETAIAKLACNQAGFEVANEAIQILGGTGFSQESLVEYCMRRCRGWMIAGGSIEILKNRIAEEVFGRRFSQRPPRPQAPAAAAE